MFELWERTLPVVGLVNHNNQVQWWTTQLLLHIKHAYTHSTQIALHFTFSVMFGFYYINNFSAVNANAKQVNIIKAKIDPGIFMWGRTT